MTIHEYKSQHDKVDSLPLITEKAVVTAVESMDQDRTAEVRKRILDLGAEFGFAAEISEDGSIDWESLFQAATDANPELAGCIGAFRDRYERAQPALVRLEFETAKPFDFAAGQYVAIKYGNRSRAYSIASSPVAEKRELCIRRVPDGRLSPRLCDDLEVGDQLTIRGPSGHLILEEQSRRDMAFLATGTGVAPMKSMIEYAFERGLDEYKGTKRDIWLFLGAAWRDDLPYHETFRDLAATHDNFQYVPCLSRESWLTSWDGETEYIQDAMLKYVDERALENATFGRHMARFLRQQPPKTITARIDPGALDVYACGINAMVYSLETAVKRLGIDDRHIHCEGYG